MSYENKNYHSLSASEQESEYKAAEGFLYFLMAQLTEQARARKQAASLAVTPGNDGLWGEAQVFQHQLGAAVLKINRCLSQEEGKSQKWQGLQDSYDALEKFCMTLEEGSPEKNAYDSLRAFIEQLLSSEEVSAALPSQITAEILKSSPEKEAEKSLRGQLARLVNFSRNVQARLLEEWKKSNPVGLFRTRPPREKYFKLSEAWLIQLNKLTEQYSSLGQTITKAMLDEYTRLVGNLFDQMTSKEKNDFLEFQPISSPDFISRASDELRAAVPEGASTSGIHNMGQP